MDACDTTANNTELWTSYLRHQWAEWLDSVGLPDDAASVTIAETTAANVAALLNIFAAAPLGQLFDVNAPGVTRFLRASAISPDATVIPEQYARGRETPASGGGRNWTPSWESTQAPLADHDVESRAPSSDRSGVP